MSKKARTQAASVASLKKLILTVMIGQLIAKVEMMKGWEIKTVN